MDWPEVILLVAYSALPVGAFILGSRFPFFSERQREREHLRQVRAEARERHYSHEREMKDRVVEAERKIIEDSDRRREERIEDQMARLYPGFGKPEPTDDGGGLGPPPMSPGEAELERASRMVNRARELEEA